MTAPLLDRVQHGREWLRQRLPPTRARVQRHTASSRNRRIQAETDARVAALAAAAPAAIDARLEALDREWDIERLLQANAGTLALTGAVLGTRVDRRFLLLPGVVFTFLAQHALSGWCPPLPLLRRLGARTVPEIERERLALKLLRGDFADVPPPTTRGIKKRVRAVLAAVDR
jgi:hypothetical protein